MSASSNNVDDAIALTGDQIDTDTPKKAAKGMPKGRIALLLGSVAMIGFVAYGMISGDKKEITSTVIVPPQINSTVGGSTMKDNPYYAEQLRLANDENADLAKKDRKTFIPTSESILTPDEIETESLPDAVIQETPQKPAEAIQITRIAPPPTMPELKREAPAAARPIGQSVNSLQRGQAGAEARENPYLSAMAGYFATATSARRPGGMAGIEFAPDSSAPSDGAAQTTGRLPNGAIPITSAPALAAAASGSDSTSPPISGADLLPVSDATGTVFGMARPDGIVINNAGSRIGALDENGFIVLDAVLPGSSPGTQIVATSTSAPIEPEQAEAAAKVYIPAGDVIYAEVLTNASSDRPEIPVIAKVTIGKYVGARLRGTFTVDQPSGKLVLSFSQMTYKDNTVPVKGLGVDGYDGDGAVRSSIDKRYMQRYAPIFASSFLSGLASGLAETNQTVVGTGDAQTVVTTEKTIEESAWQGISEATAIITDDIASRAPKGPNIKLGAGYPIGILFADDLREDPEGNEKP